MLPKIKLALLFAKLARNHGGKFLHANDSALLTRDLGLALKEQQSILSDPRRNTFLTAYDVLPVILEVKVMSLVVAKKFDIDTKNRPVISILEDIIQASDAHAKEKGLQTDPAAGIKETLEWTRDLFTNPEIRDVLSMEMTEVEKLGRIQDVPKFFKQLAFRSVDEVNRINTFLQRTKAADPSNQKKKKPGKGNTPSAG